MELIESELLGVIDHELQKFNDYVDRNVQFLLKVSEKMKEQPRISLPWERLKNVLRAAGMFWL